MHKDIVCCKLQTRNVLIRQELQDGFNLKREWQFNLQTALAQLQPNIEDPGVSFGLSCPHFRPATMDAC